MKNIEYNIPIFEYKDVADLKLYSEKMAAAIKGQIDKFGNPLVFQGIKQNKSELDLISDPKSGDIYGVVETNKNYIWNSKEWIIYSDIMELDNYYNKEEINQKIENIQALPVGGTKGQVLTKQSETEGDANWEDIEANEVFVGNEEEAPETAKIIIEDEDFGESAGLSKAEVYVGAEEPTTGEKVWFRKGKNYLDISKLKSRTSYGITLTPTDTGIKISGTATDTYAYGGKISIALKKGVEYTLSGENAGNILKIVLLKQDASTIIMNVKTLNDEITFIPTEDVFYIQFVLEGITKSTAYDYEISNLQIEQGSKAKPYKDYIEPKLFVRNSNGVYEEFAKKSEEVYSTEEQKIGTWIDGKPLYRKAFDIKTISASNTDLVNVSNLNIETLIKLNGVIITDGGGKFPVPLYDSSSNYSVLFINEYNYIRGRAMVGNGTFSKLIVTIEYTKTTD